MEEKTVTQEEKTVEQAERTFTQAEVDAIIGDRLSRERSKYADYEALKEKAGKYDLIEEEQKTEIQKMTERADALQAELDKIKAANSAREMREKIALETGVPANILSADTEDACREQAKAILAFANPGYPQVMDAGETRGKFKPTPKQQFAEWAEQAFG